MAKEEVKVVETKVAKVDRKALAEKIEAAFKKNNSVDVIADTNLENPKGMSYEEYRFIHFYKPGTQKDLFQLYITGNAGTFYVKTKVAEYLDEDIEKTPALKKQKNGEVRVNLYLIKTPIDNVPSMAEKILVACAESEKAIEQKKAEKKTTKKSVEKVNTEEPTNEKKIAEKDAKEVKTQPKKSAQNKAKVTKKATEKNV